MASDETTLRLRQADYLRQYFAATDREYTTAKNIRCPNSSAHAHGDTNASAKIYENPDGAFVKCYGCGGKWDIFSLWQLDNGGAFAQAKSALCELFGIERTPTSKPQPKRAAQNHVSSIEKKFDAESIRPTKPDKATGDYISRSAKALFSEIGKDGRAYLNGRGISDETARQFGIGFDIDAQHKYPTFGKCGAIVLPQGSGCALRSIDPAISQKNKVRFYPRDMQRVLFNGAAMLQAAKEDTPIFIVEGEIDALSIAECCGVAVSTGGAAGVGKVIKAAAMIGGGIYIPCMDRDKAGEEAQAKLIDGLRKLGGNVYVFEDAQSILLPDGEDGTHPKDINEALQQDAAALRGRVATAVEFALDYAQKAREKNRKYITLAEVPEPPDESANPRTIFKLGYLRKGGGIIAASVAGAGKSTFSLQCALHWVIGLPCFGIDPVRPLKVAVIQAEDDLEELAMFRASMKQGLTADGFTPEQITQALEALHIRTDFLGKTGAEFSEALRAMQLSDKYDLVIVNPLNSYFEGDISLNKDATEFFRKLIDPIIKNPETECGVFFIHHMGKPAKGKDAASWGKGAYAQYTMQGAAELNNWARAVLVITPFENAPGFYTLTAAKRDKPLGWKDADGKYTRDKVIAYSDGYAYWREPSADEIKEAREGKPKKQETEAERKQREDMELRQAIAAFVTWLQYVPIPKTKTDIRKWALRQEGLLFKGFHNHTVKQPDGNPYPKKPCYLAFELITENPEKYGIAYKIVKHKNGKQSELYGGVAPVSGSITPPPATSNSGDIVADLVASGGTVVSDTDPGDDDNDDYENDFD